MREWMKTPPKRSSWRAKTHSSGGRTRTDDPRIMIASAPVRGARLVVSPRHSVPSLSAPAAGERDRSETAWGLNRRIESTPAGILGSLDFHRL